MELRWVTWLVLDKANRNKIIFEFNTCTLMLFKKSDQSFGHSQHYIINQLQYARLVLMLCLFHVQP